MAEIREVTGEDEKLRDEITGRIESFAQEKGYGFGRAKDKLIRELVRMRVRFGDFYCPCQPDNVDETVCVCLEVKTGYVDEVGRCH